MTQSTKQPLVHVLGGGRWQIPTVQSARRLGYRVLVTDMYEDCPAYALADAHEVIDLRDKEHTLEAARRHGIDGVICDTTDVGVQTMAYVAEQLNLPGIGVRTAELCSNKLAQREALAGHKVPQPPFARATSVAEVLALARRVGWPVVVKPVDSQASRGVRIVCRAEDAPAALLDALAASYSGVAIVEGFLDGVESTVEGYVVDGEVAVVAISDKDHYADQPTIAWRLTYPGDFPAATLDAIVRAQTAAVRAVGLHTGVFHSEYMVIGSVPYLVEMAARGGGSRVYTEIAPKLANRDIVSGYLSYVVEGKWGKAAPLADAARQAAGLFFLRFPGGCPRRIVGLDEARRIEGVSELDIELVMGRPVPPVADDRSRHGFAVIFGQNRAELFDRFASVRKLVELEMSDGTRQSACV